ncbi:MAG: fused MFS/spermidine synthase [Deltaproteobacteria bacterium]|nr:fused MFS/spermidine synthase [Deltaproteobacteria bacterium]
MADLIKSIRLPFAIIVLGISHVTTQIAIIREFINTFSGNEIVLGVIISLWLLLTGIGAWTGKYLRNPRWHMPLFHIFLFPVAFLPLVSILLIRLLRYEILIRGELPGIGILVPWASAILIPYCILTGALFTLACSILPLRREGAVIGKVYFLDNAGDITGGLLVTYLLAHFLDNLTMLYVPTLLCLISFLIIGDLKPAKRLFPYLFGISGVVAVGIFTLYIPLGNISLAWLYPGQEIVASTESPYGRLVVTKKGDQTSFFENGEHLFSTPNILANEEIVHFALPQLRDTGKVLLVSGGMAGVIDEILKYPVDHLDYVELDPRIISLGMKLLDIHLPPEVHVHQDDGRKFIQKTTLKYNAVILDLPDPVSLQLNRFYTVEFFKEIKDVLLPQGIICFAVSGAENYISLDQASLLSTIYNSLKTVFENIIIIPGERNIFIASDGRLTENIAPIIETRGIKTNYVNENYLRGRITEEKLSFLKGSLMNDTPVNHDFRPRAYTYKMRVWLGMFQENFTLHIIICAILFIIYFIRIGTMGKILFSTGFTASSMEVIILLSYQILYGSVYTGIGLVIASFMFGLAVGSYMANRMEITGKKSIIKIEMAIIIYLLSFIAILSWVKPLSGSFVVILLAVIVGALTGAEFPLAGKLSFSSPWKTGGSLYAADLIGGSLGAFATSIFLVPLLGIYLTCFILAGFKIFIIPLLFIGDSDYLSGR